MPGKNFVVPTAPEEMAALADAAVDEVARRIVHKVTEPSGRVPSPDDPMHALTRLHVLTHLQRAAERLQRAAAVEAARAGAGYPQLGEAGDMTRQGARRRWPGLFTHSNEPPRSIR